MGGKKHKLEVIALGVVITTLISVLYGQILSLLLLHIKSALLFTFVGTSLFVLTVVGNYILSFNACLKFTLHQVKKEYPDLNYNINKGEIEIEQEALQKKDWYQ